MLFLIEAMYTTLQAMADRVQECEEVGCVFITADPSLPVVCDDCDGKPALILHGAPVVMGDGGCQFYHFRVVARLGFCVECVEDASSVAEFSEEVYRFLAVAIKSWAVLPELRCSEINFEGFSSDGLENGCQVFSMSFLIK